MYFPNIPRQQVIKMTQDMKVGTTLQRLRERISRREMMTCEFPEF
jgi:hypothetical protein